MKTFDTASFVLNDTQRALLDELYPIINEEFKADAFIQVAFQKALLQQNKKISFVTAINPVVMEMAKGLGSPLTIPLAAILSRTMADEWLATEVPKERIVGASKAFEAPYGETSVPQKDDPIILPKLAKGSTGQDRSRPVLSVAVLRGLEDLLKLDLHQESVRRGRPDARRAVKYLERLVAYGKKRESDKKA